MMMMTLLPNDLYPTCPTWKWVVIFILVSQSRTSDVYVYMSSL